MREKRYEVVEHDVQTWAADSDDLLACYGIVFILVTRFLVLGRKAGSLSSGPKGARPTSTPTRSRGTSSWMGLALAESSQS